MAHHLDLLHSVNFDCNFDRIKSIGNKQPFLCPINQTRNENNESLLFYSCLPFISEIIDERKCGTALGRSQTITPLDNRIWYMSFHRETTLGKFVLICQCSISSHVLEIGYCVHLRASYIHQHPHTWARSSCRFLPFWYQYK